jgi:hypothetical protein
MRFLSKKHALLGGCITFKSAFLLFPNHFLRFLLLLFLSFILGNFSHFHANANHQVPAKAKVAPITVAVKPITKNKAVKSKVKAKAKKLIKKDSVVVDIDPTTVSPPLFEKHL